MAKIERFDRDNLKMLREEIQAVLDMIKDEYGVALSIGGIKFSENEFHTKLTAVCGTVAEGTGSVRATLAEIDWHKYCDMLGFEESDLGKTFVSNGQVYTVSGLRMSARKYPVVCTRKDGKRFKFAEDTVRRLLKKA